MSKLPAIREPDEPGAAKPSRLVAAALVSMGLVPVLLMLYTVATNWLPAPVGDEWSTPGMLFESWCRGTLGFGDFFAQHNESRKFFPRVLYFALAQFGGWDVRREIAIVFAIGCGVTVLFYVLMRQLPGASKMSALVAWVVATFLCFSAVQFENFLWGIQLEPFFPGLALLAAAAVNMSRVPFARKCLINALLAFVATYTFAHGMLLWVLAIPLRSPGEILDSRRLYGGYAAYVLAGVAAVGTYFIGYVHPAHHPGLLGGSVGLVPLAHYLALWVGSYFASPHLNPLWIGIIVGAIFLTTNICVLSRVAGTERWRSFYPAFVMGAYASLTAGVTALGRVGFGVEQALDTRYRLHSLFFYLALVAFAAGVYCTCFRSTSVVRHRAFLALISAVGVVTFVCWVASYAAGVAEQRTRYARNVTLMRAMQWIDVIPDNPDLQAIFPIVRELSDRLHLLRDHKLLRFPLASAALGEKTRRLRDGSDDRAFGELETCAFDANRQLQVGGWARWPRRDWRGESIVIVCEDASGARKPVSVFAPESARGFGSGNAAEPVRFSRALSAANLPTGDISVSACVVDLRAKKTYPLSGAKQVRSAGR